MKKNELLKKQSSQVSKKTKANVRITVGSPGYWESVKRRAQEIYEERIQKNLPGDETSDWLKAEQEIKSRC